MSDNVTPIVIPCACGGSVRLHMKIRNGMIVAYMDDTVTGNELTMAIGTESEFGKLVSAYLKGETRKGK